MTWLQDIMELCCLPEPETTFADESPGEGRILYGGQPNPPEFIAQVDGSADLRWVDEIRWRTKLPELKFRGVDRWLHQIDSHLHGAMEETWKRTNIVITDPAPYLRRIEDHLREEYEPELVEKCLAHRPFSDMLKERAARDVLWETPLFRLGWLAVMSRPGLWLPGMSNELPIWASPSRWHNEFKGNLRKAREFVGRLNATYWALCDDTYFEEIIRPTLEESLVFCWRPNCARVLLMENAPSRVFDEGNDKVLGDIRRVRSESLKDVVADHGIVLPAGWGLIESKSSEKSDHLQAADLAAGFAREEYQRADIPGVLTKFRAVLYNGKVIR